MEEAETKIRITVKDEYFRKTGKAAIDRKVFAIIKEAMKSVTIPTLRAAAERSLLNFYLRQYEELRRSFGWQMAVLAALYLLDGRCADGREIEPTRAEKDRAVRLLETVGFDRSRLLGSPLRKYTKEYVEKNVRPALDRLAKQESRDPNDVSGRNTLRNKAEMEVRWQAHLDEIADLKTQGVRLVICSTHADCSERCAKWQGLVYSLDGTYGVTDDGRKYQPLENATDIYYTTKAGQTYKNGLLGFNCRHFLVPYESGYRFPNPNVTEERREYEITQTQRRMEAQVRHWRTRAVESKNLDPDRYKEARQNAIEMNRAYIEFSRANNRAYYPSRTKLI